MKPTLVLPAIALFSLVTVEFGGWSLLSLLNRRDGLSSFQEQFFRAGHAHAGVLLVLSLVFFVFLGRTSFSEPTQWVLGVGLLVGILMQSGGFFLHLLVGQEGTSSVGTLVTRIGAVLLAAALITLGVGLLRAGAAAASAASQAS